MSEKPRKRLVGWAEYAATLGKKGANYSLAVFCACVSCLLACFGIGLFFYSIGLLSRSREFGANYGELGFQFLVCSGFLIGFCIAGMWVAVSLWKKGKQIEPVSPITHHNTGNLPAVETLVRASDSPPTDLPAQLLRVARHGQETPPEELLRATSTRQE